MKILVVSAFIVLLAISLVGTGIAQERGGQRTTYALEVESSYLYRVCQKVEITYPDGRTEIQCHCHFCDARYGHCPLTPCP